MATYNSTFRDSPPESQDHGRGGERIRETRSETLLRFQTEHHVGDASTATGYSTDDGRHNPGSARAYTGAVSPTQLLRPDGGGAAVGPSSLVTALGATDVGRVWFDESGGALVTRVWNSTGWQGTYGIKNFFINGAMQVWQRGTLFSPVVGTDLYCADRFFARTEGAGAAAVQRVASAFALVPRSTYVSRLTGVPGITTFNYSQRVESTVIAPLLHDVGTVTFSCRIRNNTAAPINPTFEVYTADALDDFSPVTSRSGPHAVPALAAGTDAYYSRSIDLNALVNAANGVQFTLHFGALTAASVDVGEWLLESGGASVAANRSHFWQPPFAEDLLACQRYYEKTFNYNEAPAVSSSDFRGALTTLGTGIDASERSFVFRWPFKQIKARSNYTLTYYSPQDANALPYNLTDGNTVTGTMANLTSTVGGEDLRGEDGVSFTHTGGTATNDDSDILAIHVTCDAELV